MQLKRRDLLTALPLLAAFGSAAQAATVSASPLVRSAVPLPPRRGPVDGVLVEKKKRRLSLLHEGRTVRRYRIALGRNPEGHKRQEGDGRTPEGHYLLDWRNPRSRFYRSIHISYPAPEDLAAAERLGVPPGGAIMIHGLPQRFSHLGSRHTKWDWTEGCIAVANEEMDEIWQLVVDGTPIVIRA